MYLVCFVAHSTYSSGRHFAYFFTITSIISVTRRRRSAKPP